MPVVTGTSGDDTLVGGSGDDTFEGGAGFDTVAYASATGGVTVDLGALVQSASGAAGHDGFASIEGIIGSDFDDVLTGDNPYLENTTLVSAAMAGGVADGASYVAAVSPNGRYVLFSSLAGNLVPGDSYDPYVTSEDQEDLFLKDLQTGAITRLNITADGQRLMMTVDAAANRSNSYVFAPDNKAVYFVTMSFEPEGETVYRKDLVTGALTVAATFAADSDIHTREFNHISLSADGKTLYYEAMFSADGFYYDTGVYARNLATGATTLLTPEDPNGGLMGGSSYSGSNDGQWFAYCGLSFDMAGPGDTRTDIFLRNLHTGETRLIGHDDQFYSLTWGPVRPTFSGDSQYLLFVSETPNLTPDDGTLDANAFLMNIATGETVKLPFGIVDYELELQPPVFVGNTHMIAYFGYDRNLNGANQNYIRDLIIYDPDTGQSHTVLYDVVYQGGVENLVTFSADGTIGAVNPAFIYTQLGTMVRNDNNYYSDVIVFDPRQTVSHGGDDRLSGGKGNDQISGLGGNDTLSGDAGSDLLEGGAGNDLLLGGAGNDTYIVNGYFNNTGIDPYSGEDVLNDSGGDDTIVVHGTAGPANLKSEIVGDDIVLTFGYGGAVRVVGGLYNPVEHILFANSAAGQTVTGGAAAETLHGGAGGDRLDGGAGGDTMYGGGDSDTYYVDNAGDLASEQSTAGADDGGREDVVYASVSYALDAYVEDLRLTGSGNLAGTGNVGDNLVIGNSGNNRLDGGDGDDFLVGGAGNDTLLGGRDNDILRGGLGADYLDGGVGAVNAGTSGALSNPDYADYSAAASGIVLHMDNSGGNTGEAAGDTLINIEGVIGTAFDDTLYGANDAVYLQGGGGNDHIISGGNREVNQIQNPSSFYGIDGGAGDDFIEAGRGQDLINGGDGIDTVSYLGASQGIYLDAVIQDNLNPDRDGDAWGDGVTGVEIIWGTNYDDIIFSPYGQLFGFGGNDTLSGYAGDDYLDGGTGADVMFGGFTTAVTQGNDTYVVDSAGDQVYEGARCGTDLVVASINYTLGGNFENLTLTGNAALNGTGNALGNILRGNSGVNTLTGLGGNDTYYVDNTADVVVEVANEGVDLVYASAGFTLGANVEGLILTGTGAIDGTGNGLNNIITGNGGSNRLDGGAGADVLTGFAGNDSYVVDQAGDRIVEAAGEGTDSVYAALTWSLGANLERLYLTGTANIYGLGNGLNNQITGNAGNNRLDGGLGADTLIGGLGGDSFYVDDAGDKVAENVNEGLDQVYASVSYALGSNVENLQLMGTADLNATGNGLNNVIWGTSGANRLDGAAGIDKLLGGLGDDTYIVDNSSDQATDVADGGIDIVFASQSHILNQYVENLTLTGSANITATGNAMDNILIGNAGNNRLTGGTGMDAMTGGAGHDTYYVDNIGDTATEGLNAGIDLVQSTVTFTLSDNVENLFLNGTGDLNGTGNAINNLITGTAGNNILDGQGGVDKLFGGLGDDTYYLDNASDSAKDEASGGHDVVYSSASWVATAYIEDLFLTGSANITGTGNALANILSGNGGNNKLDGGTGNDTLTGGLGNDTFVFIANSGIDVITDFTTSDYLSLKAYSQGVKFGGGVTVIQNGADVLVDLGGGNTVTVLNSLQADVASHIFW